MKHEVYTVENPVLLSLDKIKEKYWDNYVLVTNTEGGGKTGIVRHYCYANEPELTEIIMEMDKNAETYGDCLLFYVGPGRGFPGAYI